ncbi:MAG TPA: 1-phosphofructokinase family hexose kinase [Pyrinomonadaceae bacterium]|nr:1-phosphofructokinase family hexose kinase [Pyrinomonadaceae bacterium]
MLFCISANPAVDRRLQMENIAVGEINRALSTQPFPGGKAAHVAMVARALGLDVMWIGFLGGAAGEQCESGLTELGIPLTVIRTHSETRANLELISADGRVTEILEPGGAVTEGEVERLLTTCRDLFAESERGTQVAISGSLPPGAPSDLYAELIRLAHVHGCRTLLDTSGEALIQALSAEPDFVKPNRHEASTFAGCAIDGPAAAVEVTQRFFNAGAKSVAISLGADGMIFQRAVSRDAFVAVPSPLAECSPVGCGDAALAGFAVAYERELSDEETLRLAAACGAANCMADAPGRVDASMVQRLGQAVAVRRVLACESSRHVAVEAQ